MSEEMMNGLYTKLYKDYEKLKEKMKKYTEIVQRYQEEIKYCAESSLDIAEVVIERLSLNKQKNYEGAQGWMRIFYGQREKFIENLGDETEFIELDEKAQSLESKLKTKGTKND